MDQLTIITIIWLIAGIIGFYAQKYTSQEIDKIGENKNDS